MSITYSALREYHRRVAAMLDDPECTGDLLGLGIALLDFAVLRINRDERSWRTYAQRAWGDPVSEYRIRGVLKGDIRRYDALKDADGRDPSRRCGAPMARRNGPCGASAARRALLTDSLTGRKQWLAGCRRHEEWFNAEVIANRSAVGEATEAIQPAANAGGVLARHIPEIDWEAMWKQLDPEWTPPPEGAPEQAPVFPKLRLILGGPDYQTTKEGTA